MKQTSVLRITSWEESDVTRRVKEAVNRGYILKQRGGGVWEASPTPTQKYWAILNKEQSNENK